MENTDFKKGDTVKILYDTINPYNNGKIGIVESDPKWVCPFIVNIDGQGYFMNCTVGDRMVLVKNSVEENKMEYAFTIASSIKLEDCDKNNLKEAQKQYDKEKANAEIEFAKKKLRELNDRWDTLEREIVLREKEQTKIEEELKAFE